MDIETPFPVTGTVTSTEYGYSATLPCANEWVSETENGDMLKRAVDRAHRKYGEGVEVEVTWYGAHGICNTFEIHGPVNEIEDQ